MIWIRIKNHTNMNTYCEQNKKQFYIYYYIKKVIFNLFRINLYQTTVLSNIRGIRVEYKQ